ncbi:MAG TPA: DUF1266 domain-containing protein [Candidatus Obscuribacter sp.]|nr:DUF1266 domain-containing protein [Candidatus Obscuribacter sp.]HND07435.1 DUF1266 domain-containing protein [Candidatus Obscuribacter sp.]HNM49613.1 DUF1266 domain-containing protein [Candidatus Obscuribacter sp.]
MTKLKVAAIVSTVALALSLGIALYWPQLQKGLPQKEQADPTLVEMPPPAREREDHQLFYVGYNLFVRGKLDDAEAVFRRSLGINPKSADAHYGLAFSANHRGDKLKALDEYNRAIDLNPRLADAYNDRGNLYMSMHNTSAALRDYSIAMLICPWNAANYEDRAETYLERKEYLKVIADATRAIDRDPKLTRAFQYRAAAWQALGKSAQALADLDIACKNEKETNFALSARAKLKTSMKDIKGAINDYGLALARKKDDPAILRDRAGLYAQIEDYDRAVVDCKQLVKIYSDSPEVKEFTEGWLSRLENLRYDKAHGDLTDAERYPLLLSALYWQRMSKGTYSLLGGSPGKEARDEAIDSLKENYSVYNRNDLLNMLEHLMLTGDSKGWQLVGNAIDSGASHFQIAAALSSIRKRNDENLDLLPVLQEKYLRYKGKELLGWDLCRYILVARNGYIAGFLTREEALARLKAASQVLQDKFTSYEEVGENMLTGKSVFSQESWSDAGKEMLPIYDWLKKDNNSPWKQIPFKIALVTPDKQEQQTPKRSTEAD